MNKQELQNEINKTKEHLANMEKMLAECEYERWKPDENEEYFVVAAKGVMDCLNVDSTVWKAHFNFYNCFQTRKQAKAEAEKILVRRQLEDIAKRLNKGKKIEWRVRTQEKNCIDFNYAFDELVQNTNAYIKRQGTVYCLDDNFLDVAKREIGEERLKKYLRGE